MSTSLQKYIEGVLKRFEMERCKPVSTPPEQGRKFQELPDDEHPYDVQQYQMIIGCFTHEETATLWLQQLTLCLNKCLNMERITGKH